MFLVLNGIQVTVHAQSFMAWHSRIHRLPGIIDFSWLPWVTDCDACREERTCDHAYFCGDGYESGDQTLDLTTIFIQDKTVIPVLLRISVVTIVVQEVDDLSTKRWMERQLRRTHDEDEAMVNGQWSDESWNLKKGGGDQGLEAAFLACYQGRVFLDTKSDWKLASHSCVLLVYNLQKSANISYPCSFQPEFLPQIYLQNDSSERLSDTVDGYEFFRYPYKDIRTNVTKYGKVLPVARELLRKYQIPIKYLETLDADNVLDFVFVTGSSSNHFRESLDAIATIQEQFPKHRIMFYDWGLSSEQIAQLKTLCGVTYMPFDFSLYPASKWQSGRSKFHGAKILCIMEALINNSGVFWVDASVRFLDSSAFSVLFQNIIRNGGFGMVSNAYHSTYAATHPNMYTYLPTDMEFHKQCCQLQSGATLMYKTHRVFDGIIWPWFLCSLTAECMTPTMQLDCKFQESDRLRTYACCHRVDQSALNILASNLYNHNESEYNFASDIFRDGVFEILRESEGKFTPNKCKNKMW
ncbi:hypothetical protein CAPTEDRAFT_197713 [Capitella teleta]|uniref:Uncharacterized protein n=1 Tax=Capitella teleta TaxID=283909 RepID=R7U5T1_CAPTE|nr:hypothetical protein CAPTEDRAFT_197713 [Capitella teleta]|eukprot:ELT99056.1 hypothetical protein CAPTEDRAFT_197713 [Capitella teleta]